MEGGESGIYGRADPEFLRTVLVRHVASRWIVGRANRQAVDGPSVDRELGVQDLAQMFTRPVARWNPYTTPSPDIFLCSASTPPGAGVHGMAGYFAARTALKSVFGWRQR